MPDKGQISYDTDTFGEDSDYTKNPPAYTKLDASGKELEACATEFQCALVELYDQGVHIASESSFYGVLRKTDKLMPRGKAAKKFSYFDVIDIN